TEKAKELQYISRELTPEDFAKFNYAVQEASEELSTRFNINIPFDKVKVTLDLQGRPVIFGIEEIEKTLKLYFSGEYAGAGILFDGKARLGLSEAQYTVAKPLDLGSRTAEELKKYGIDHLPGTDEYWITIMSEGKPYRKLLGSS